RAAPSHQDEPSGLRFGRGALAAPGAAAAQRLAPRLDFVPRAPVAADPLEVAARRRVAAQALERYLECGDVRLHRADPLEVLVLAERRLDPTTEGLRRSARSQQERRGPVAELELA